MSYIDELLIKNQSTVFLDEEGDNWFKRNYSCLRERNFFYETEVIKRVLSEYITNIDRVLEIGCSSGFKLLDLCSFFNAKGCGIDPSIMAINHGNDYIEQFSNIDIKLEVGTALNLTYKNSSFDLVYFGFCLYLLDRQEIFQAVAEADRVLKAGGFLVIVDFDPSQQCKVPYSHKEGIFSYKTSYANFFLSNGHYYLVAKESMSHNANYFTTDSNERVSICILYKEPDSYRLK